jgi:hypothetical protein
VSAGCFGLHRFVQRHRRRVDAAYRGEADGKEGSLILHGTGQEVTGDTLHFGVMENDGGEFAHECLAVCTTFARDDEVGIADEFIEVQVFQQQFSTGTALGIQELHESVTQTAGSPRTRLTAPIEPQATGILLSKSTGSLV